MQNLQNYIIPIFKPGPIIAIVAIALLIGGGCGLFPGRTGDYCRYHKDCDRRYYCHSKTRNCTRNCQVDSDCLYSDICKQGRCIRTYHDSDDDIYFDSDWTPEYPEPSDPGYWDDNGSDDNGSDDNGSDDNGSDDNGSDDDGWDDDGWDDDGWDEP
jgi:hypothetical protein